MKLYFCREKNNHNIFAGSLGVNGYVSTSDFTKATLHSDVTVIKKVASRHPELEVCCCDATVFALDEATASKTTDVSESAEADIDRALHNFERALEELDSIRRVKFCQVDDHDSLSYFSNTEYDAEDDCIYVNLVYRLAGDGPKKSTTSLRVGKMNL